MKKYFYIACIFAVSIHAAYASCLPSGSSCSACTTYRCNAGYYGTATSASSGCTACPANATCAGGNGSIFICAKGYYKSGASCEPCPPTGATTTGIGATSKTECYIPSGTSFSDTGGNGTYTGDCYYVN